MHTGPVVIADGGEVFGETANIAARVQGAADPDTVVVTAATQRLVPGIFVLEERGPQALKGVCEPVALYRVVQPSGVRSRLAVAAGRLAPFVGREVELATLVDRWERAADGEGQNVLLVAGETAAVADIVAGLSIGAETGFQAGAPFLLNWLAEAYMIAGQLVEARNAVDMALAGPAQTGQPGAHAELQGLQGEIALRLMDGHRSGSDAEIEAEERFRTSLDIARAQDAKAYELRAATRLARLWRGQNKRAEARDLLAPVYAWFTEGFDTRDLIEAKALLEDL